MPRPTTRDVTFSIDGREVTAPENAMLVDAAKYGDVEIPVFCYEPKLGQPVGACRMCLVEIEGIPKLQTACSTPVKDGMVVHTQTDRVHDAQRAVVEFLLINHPLDCPVCDKGGECPLQDITYGWGPGTSRFIEPKRHFKKPLELSPLVAIDRERCILCYRCVRFSQEISEDYQLILLERGAHSYVGTFDGHPYVAPFSGNIVELCPVGALTSSAYRFRARPWDIEGAGSICTLCPAQCNVEFTVRDDRVMRVLARDNPDVDDGWLCDKGRFGYQSIHVDERITQPLVREGTNLMPASWEKALERRRHRAQEGGRPGRRAGRRRDLQRGGVPAPAAVPRGARLEPPVLAPRRRAAARRRARARRARRCGATVPDLEFAHTVVLLECDPVDDAPILDLRIRKGVRRHHVRLAIASARPTALDARADVVERIAPGGGAALLVALAEEDNEFARSITEAGEDIVIVYGERLLSGPNGEVAAKALLNLAARLGLADRPGAGLLEIPSTVNGRGLREAGFAPGHGPGFATLAEPGRGAAEIAAGLADADLSVLYLLHADPLRTHPDRGLWKTALGTAQTVIAHESVMTETVREYADVVFPAEAYAEKEGTLTHPDGRLQRLRTAIGRPQPSGPGSGVRARLAGHRRRRRARRPRRAHPRRADRLAAAVRGGPVLRRPDARRDRRPGRALAGARRGRELRRSGLGAGGAQGAARARAPSRARCGSGPTARCGARRRSTSRRRCTSCARSRWSSSRPSTPSSSGSPTATASRSGSNGTRVRGAVRLREAVPSGSVFLADGTRQDGANALTEALVEIARVGGPRGRRVGRSRARRAGRRGRRDAAVRAAGDPAHRPEPVGARRMSALARSATTRPGGSSCSRAS